MPMYLHVGAHKTGTTLIQQALRHNKEVLESAGVFYTHTLPPDRFARRTRYHTAVERLLTTRELDEATVNTFEEYWERVREVAEFKECSTVLTSREGYLGFPLTLYPRRRGRINRLYAAAELPLQLIADTSGFDDIVPILYIRSQAGWFDSCYREMIVQGDTRTIDEVIESVDLTALSWQTVIDRLTAIFGSVIVRPYRLPEIGAAAHLNEFVSLFEPVLCDKLEVPELSDVETNRSLSAVGLELARGINKLLPDEPRSAIVRLIQEQISSAEFERGSLMPEAAYDELDAMFSHEMHTLITDPATVE